MDIPKVYAPNAVEDKWYEYWMKNGYFHSEPDERESYTIVIPPPNVTGVLHMGHMLNNTIQDVLVRRARMQGKNACWVPGTDHASIATEAKVVAKLKEEGIDKADLSREAFLEHAWEWKNKYGGIILEQLKKLGASCDWERTKFTMDEDLSNSVIETFIDLYRKGHIYRGVRMVNWDPSAQTALSDEEVIHKEVDSMLYSVRYRIAGEADSWITIATTRPETILGDTAICVNPNDERYAKMKGKKAIVPLINREIPIIYDEYVDMEFGTGALKVTPAHDINDYNLGIKHNLESIDILNDDGTLNENAQLFVGVDRFKVRKDISKQLGEEGYLIGTKNLRNKVGYSERTDAVIEPKLSMQWFCKMEELAKPALDNVMNDNVEFFPKKFKNSYRHWMENVKDWCVSRQLWWGQRIPAWYFGSGANDYVIAKTVEEAIELAKVQSGKDDITVRQDDDVLDTWFSSWLWPMSVFNGLNEPDNAEINYYYPTNDLVTAPEIMFFWVARMIMAGYEYKNELPFRNVYYTGIVRDEKRRKMSKSLGNSPDPIELIQKYGADGVRVGMLLSSPAGNDLLFDEKLCEQGSKFANKLWNAFRLIAMWDVDESLAQPEGNAYAIKWLESRIGQEIEQIQDHFDKFRLSDALMAIYKLIWDDYCSWLLEAIKPEYEKPVDPKTKEQVLNVLDKLLKIAHPFIPFITEEIWQRMEDRKDDASIMVTLQPDKLHTDPEVLASFSLAQEIITNIRSIRKQKNIPSKNPLKLSAAKGLKSEEMNLIQKLCNVESIVVSDDKPNLSASFIVKGNEFHVPLEAADMDVEAEMEKIEKELTRAKGLLTGVMKKLSNERFVQNAPEQVIEMEKKKQSDAEEKIKILEEQLVTIKS